MLKNEIENNINLKKDIKRQKSICVNLQNS